MTFGCALFRSDGHILGTLVCKSRTSREAERKSQGRESVEEGRTSIRLI